MDTEIDFTGLWTWTVPLWGIGAIVFILTAILSSPTEILTHFQNQMGGSHPHGRFPGCERKSRTKHASINRS